MSQKEKAELLVTYITFNFTQIRLDWSDPRFFCREGIEASKRLIALIRDTKSGESEEEDEQYYIAIQEVMDDSKL